jgi:hypothetical protein
MPRFTTTDYKTTLKYHELRMAQQDARHALTASYKQARDKIDTAKAVGRSPKTIAYILAHAERNGMTYEGAEQELIVTGRLQAMFNDARGQREDSLSLPRPTKNSPCLHAAARRA